ncbi:MAG: hypothetical protein Q8N47_17900 [Bryobacterales bacterium]|nr:hypothetical protein [Bryobacterales bacterium]
MMTTQLRLTHGALLALALSTLQGQTPVDLRTQGKVDLMAANATPPIKTGTRLPPPFKTGANLPPTCQIGEAFLKTDTAAGQNLYGCVAANTWAVQSSADAGPTAPFDDFQPTVTGRVLAVAAGRARIGNYVPVTIDRGMATFTSGTGDVKVFIDTSNNLVCHMQTGIVANTSGAMACSNVSRPGYPPNSIPVADLTVNNGTPTIDSDDRAFLTTRGVSAGTGISIADAGGVASIGIDTATVPQLGAGSNDFTGSVSALEFRFMGSSEGSCDSANRGRLVSIFGGPGVADTVKMCVKSDSDTYAWKTIL